MKLENKTNYVDDTFMIWPHRLEELKNLNRLTNIHPNIQFTMETELNGLHIHLQKTRWLFEAHCIQKDIHTNLYLNTASYNHPDNKHSVLSTFIHQARAICDQNSLPGEPKFLCSMLR